jgi:hypothetical protein
LRAGTVPPVPVERPKLSLLQYLLAAAGTVLLVTIIVYEGVIFLQTESALDQLRRGWDGSGWEVVYDDLPASRSYFGYPKREGWKTVGVLRSQGLYPGDFRSVNEDFIIPIWYNYGEARSCYNTPAHFFVRSGEGEPASPAEGYLETGRISREGEVRLYLFSARAEVTEPIPLYRLETLEDQFDRQATPEQFARQAEPTHRLETQFGPAIRLVGYDLDQPTIAPGETLYLNLYWQATEVPGGNYRAFVHLTDGMTLWGQQDDDPACRLPTAIWRAGQHGLGQFRVVVDPETPPGRYPLVIGLYQAETLERVKISGGAGQPGDDFLWLGDIEVTGSE